MSYRIPARALLAAAAALALFVFRDYAVTWDEPDHNAYGRTVVRFYASGGRDLPDDPYLHLYGAAFDAPAALLGAVSPLGVWPTRHLFNAAVGLLGVAGARACAVALAGEGAGFWAAFLLLLTPCWWGHMFGNPKDVPFAAGYIWSVALMLRALAAWPAIPARLVAALGVAMGLTMGVRVGGVILLGFLAVGVLWRASGPDDPGIRKAAGRAAVSALLAWAVMLAFWPRALMRPVSWPLEALTKFMHYFPLNFSVIFRGEMYPATALPWDYIPAYLLIQLPEPVVLLLGAGLVAGAAAVARSPRPSREEAGRWALVVAAAVVPVMLVIAGRSVVYNGLRHLLFVVPVLAAIAGVVLDSLVRRLAGRPRWVAAGAALLGAGWLAWHLSLMIRIHPYQYVYYNSFVGGVRGAFTRYENDYWGMSFPEAVRGLRNVLTTEPKPPRPWRVASCGAPRAFHDTLSPEFEWAGDLRDADFVAVLIGMGCPGIVRGARTVVMVSRFGVPLSFVLDQRRPASGR